MGKCNVYTRTGDEGTTSLADGTRVEKSSERLEAYGTVDELNSHLGLLLTYVEEETLRERIILCQHQLFCIGSQLATNPTSGYVPRHAIEEKDIRQLELDIDATSEGLPGWRGFTLPGGCRVAAQAHVCRTVCRRAERLICALPVSSETDKKVCCYMNRLSDYLYVLAQKLNFIAGEEEILWKKV